MGYTMPALEPNLNVDWGKIGREELFGHDYIVDIQPLFNGNTIGWCFIIATRRYNNGILQSQSQYRSIPIYDILTGGNGIWYYNVRFWNKKLFQQIRKNEAEYKPKVLSLFKRICSIFVFLGNDYILADESYPMLLNVMEATFERIQELKRIKKQQEKQKKEEIVNGE